MRVTRIGNHLAVAIPEDVASSLGLREGDEVEVSRVAASDPSGAPMMTREEALAQLRALRWTFPPDFKFDREEANER